MNTLWFILGSFGAANILVNESIFNRLRNFINKWFPYSLLNKLFKCVICMSFWCGVSLYWLMDLNTGYIILDMFIAGCIASGCSKIIEHILLKFN